MTSYSKNLLKNGIMAIINEDENHFKQNIIDSLSLKFNDFITETKQDFYKNLFIKNEIIAKTKEIQYFVSFNECFSPGNFNLQDGTNINISEEDMKNIIWLFENLNPEQKQTMASDIFNSAQNFKSNLNFAKKVKELTK